MNIRLVRYYCAWIRTLSIRWRWRTSWSTDGLQRNTVSRWGSDSTAGWRTFLNHQRTLLCKIIQKHMQSVCWGALPPGFTFRNCREISDHKLGGNNHLMSKFIIMFYILETHLTGNPGTLTLDQQTHPKTTHKHKKQRKRGCLLLHMIMSIIYLWAY